MEKMTEYLGKYIINKYDVSSEKSTGDIVKWNKCVKKTKEMINSVREDMKSGTCRLYYEASIYWEPKIQKQALTYFIHNAIIVKSQINEDFIR